MNSQDPLAEANGNKKEENRNEIEVGNTTLPAEVIGNKEKNTEME
jgi:hypothetical protein